jgi:hypothetical protein
LTELVIGILAGIVVTLVAWGAKQFFTRRQLYLIQPRLFDYSGLDERNTSKTVELTVLNSGRRSEEDIRVQFAPQFSYTVLASSVSGLDVKDGVMRIDRLAPRQQVTVVLVAEGGEFRVEHLTGLASKDCVGKVKASLQEAKSSQSTVLATALFMLFLAFGYGFGKFVEVALWPFIGPYLSGQPQALTFTSVMSGKIVPPGMNDVSAAKYIDAISIKKMERRGAYVFVEVELTNSFQERLEATLSVASPVHDERGEFARSDYIVSGASVLPGSSRTFLIGDYLPSEEAPQALYLKASLRVGVKSVWINKDITAHN